MCGPCLLPSWAKRKSLRAKQLFQTSDLVPLGVMWALVPVRLLARRLELGRRRRVLSASWLLSPCSLGSWVGFSRVVLRLTVRVVGFAVGDSFDARGVCG